MRLYSIVEGHAEIEALPILLRRMLAEMQRYDVLVQHPMRVPRGSIVNSGGLERAVDLVGRRAAPEDGILILIDADDDCAAQLGPALLARAQNARTDRHSRVTCACREFENWFAAAASSLADGGHLRPDLEIVADPEAIRDPKAWITKHRAGKRPYSPVLDQPVLVSAMSLSQAQSASSFQKLWRDVGLLVNKPD